MKADPGIANIPLLLISAKAAAHDRQAGLDAGADDYLAKPFAVDALLDRIRHLWPAGIAGDAAAMPLASTAASAPSLVRAAEPDPALTAALAELANAEFGVATWAQRVNLSERQLRRRVVEATGHAPLVWLREQRLQRVRALVSSGECKTLVQAGARCGLDNPSYLYRIYRARFGDSGS